MTLLDRVRAAEHRCRGCGIALTDHPDIPWCSACLREINRAYRTTGTVAPIVERRRFPAKDMTQRDAA